ncbi:MAG: bifunctional DNA-binding transcriptional regulator [Lentimonas sp.]|jgi:bifunctional DNA-binding transcriptional regulator/antitoxin component of YhaV-PrlF toxin-antitoxin module
MRVVDSTTLIGPDFCSLLQLLDFTLKTLHCFYMITSKVTKRGQTTLPRQIRNALQVEAGQSLVYEVTEAGVMLRAHPGAMASFGALKPKQSTTIDYDQARRASREDWIEHVAEEGSSQ